MLDDRKPESLPAQAVAELRRFATECRRLAAVIEHRAAEVIEAKEEEADDDENARKNSR